MPDNFIINGQSISGSDFKAAVQVFEEATGQNLTSARIREDLGLEMEWKLPEPYNPRSE